MSANVTDRAPPAADPPAAARPHVAPGSAPDAAASWPRRLLVATSLLMIAVVAAHAVLIPSGRWQGDEYFNFAAMRQAGLPFVVHRLLRWSPRPLSELLVYLYASAVQATARPLVWPVLGAGWAVWVAGAACGLPPVGPAWRWRLLIVGAVLALSLLFHPVGEAFYWPMAALAYLPSFAGVTCAALLVIGDITTSARRRGACSLALVVAAASTEAGAVFVLCFTALFALAGRRAPGGRLWWSVPMALAAAVLALMATGRMRYGGEAAPGGAGRHVLASILVALPALARGAAGAAAGAGTGAGTGAGAATPFLPAGIWLAVAGAGFALCLPRAGVRIAPIRHLAALAAAAALAAGVTAASAVFQFGVPCCQRHATFEGILLLTLVLALAAMGAHACVARRPGRVPPRRRDGRRRGDRRCWRRR